MNKKIGIITLIVIICIATIIPIAYANGDTPPTSDKFISADNVNILIPVDGDLYAVGNYIEIEADIAGDLLTGGNSIFINADVDQNIRAGGNFITLNDVNAKNMTLFGQSIKLNNVNANNVYLFGSSVNFSGKAHDAFMNGGRVTINGTITGYAEINANTVIISENAKILGTLDVVSSNDIIYKGDVDQENINFTRSYFDIDRDNDFNEAPVEIYHGQSILRLFIKFVRSLVTIYVTALIMMLVFSTPVKNAVDNLRKNTFKPVLLGLVVFAAIPVLVFLAMFTIIGIPMALAVLLVYVLVILLARSFSALAFADIAFPNMNKYLSLLIAAAILSVIKLIPILNVIVWFVLIGYSFGSLLLVFNKKNGSPKNNLLEASTEAE